MRIRILKAGLLSTIQDMGRHEHLSQAVPVSGVMDTLSARIANKALGNDDNNATIEFTYADAAFIAETDLLIAYAGDGATLSVNGQHIPAERPVFIPALTTINLIPTQSGVRTYLAIAGGWDVPEVLGSRSTFLTFGFGGFNGRLLKKGDILNSVDKTTTISAVLFERLKNTSVNYPAWGISLRDFELMDKKTIRVVAANEFTWFDKASITNFFSAPYLIGRQSNRMGYFLDGPVIERVKPAELLSTAVCLGTIQVTGNGTMIILMADCQTTGGYPRIAQIATVDMPKCAQLRPGDAVYFKQLERDEAEKLYIEREQQLQQLTTAISAKFL